MAQGQKKQTQTLFRLLINVTLKIILENKKLKNLLNQPVISHSSKFLGRKKWHKQVQHLDMNLKY